MFIGIAALALGTSLATGDFPASSSKFLSEGRMAHGTVIRCMLARENQRLEREERYSLDPEEEERTKEAARLEGITEEEALVRRRGFRYLL